MVELKGSLGGLGLPAVVQLIGELRHTGTLKLASGTSRAAFAFDDGRLVAVEYGERHGLDALAAVALELGDAEFTFVEETPTLDRTLDLSAAESKALLARIASGDFAQALEASSVAPNGEEQLTCPLLGFADERDRHYSRPTALHRCYASGAPSLVTSQEQRELCLGGRYATCARYRNAAGARPAAEESAPEPEPTLITPAAQSEPTLVASTAAPVHFAPNGEHDTTVALPPPVEAEPRPAIPPAVATRLAAASQMQVSPVSRDETETAQVRDLAAAVTNEEPPAPPAGPPKTIEALARFRPAGVLLIAGGAVVGIILAVLVLMVVLPLLGIGQQRAPATVPAFEPVPTGITRTAAPLGNPTIAVAAKPTVAPTVPPTPTAALPTPTFAPRTNIAVTPAQSLMDVRFASGAAPLWVNNPPFGEWSDGAYRMNARQTARFVAVGVPIGQVLSDVVVSATFRKTGGPPGGGYGLIVRDQGPEPRDGVNQQMYAYVLEAGDQGDFGIWRRDGDHWIDLVPWTRSATIRQGGSPNDLVVRAIGDRLTFTINGAQVGSVQDDTFPSGGVALFVGGDNNEVALDRFTVQLPN